MGNGKTPVDRRGRALKEGDRVWVLNAYDGEVFYESVVTGFEEEPDFDRTCVGIYVAGQGGSLHPILVEQVEEGK